MSTKQLHKKWRKEFNAAVFKRDKNKCRLCGEPAVDAHHITDRHDLPNGGYVLSNGISLCEKCHIKVEDYHVSNGKFYKIGFHPNDLYKMIDSSYEIAYSDSENLMPC